MSGEIDYSVLTDSVTMSLLKDIERFPQLVQDAASKYEPFIISRFVMSVAQHFNKFYHDHQINVDDINVKMARLKVVELAKKTLKDGLDLLGIKCPEQM